MQINVSGHHIDITPALRDYVNSKFLRLENHIDDITTMEVVLQVEKLRHTAKGNVRVKGGTLHAAAEHDDMYAAIDGLADKLHRQAIKHKEKHQDDS